MTHLIPFDRYEWIRLVRRCDLSTTGLSASAADHVAVTLAGFGNADGTKVFPGVKLLAKCTKRGERTVKRALARLRELELLTLVVSGSRHGLGRADEYRLTYPEDLAERVPMLAPNMSDSPIVVPGMVAMEEPGPPDETITRGQGGTDQGPGETGAGATRWPPTNHVPPIDQTMITNNSGHFGSVEGNGEPAKPKSDLGLSYGEAFKINQSLGGSFDTYIAAVQADAVEHGLDPPHGEALVIAVAKWALVDHPELLPIDRRTA
ncbi:helix-turn-helix domain-containing protein [Nonomuraea sp. MTCD27]|uniref:helix-turn-helix domain-containing protein n=1 Tax=Nonomuraea sp. MTCD27 TaxID=1676747 RepID=UPI0035BF328F